MDILTYFRALEIFKNFTFLVFHYAHKLSNWKVSQLKERPNNMLKWRLNFSFTPFRITLIQNSVNNIAMYHERAWLNLWDGWVLAGYLHPLLVKLNYIFQRISKTIVTVPYNRLLFMLVRHSLSSFFHTS